MDSENFVTYKEMVKSQDDTKQDIIDRIEKGDKRVDKLDDKINDVDKKVDHLNDLVLPMTVAMKQTAENTKDISESLKEFTRNQSTTNNIFHEKINAQALSIQGIENIAVGMTDKKKYNATVVAATIGLVGIFVAGMFQLAPIIFNH